jgi:hypothetical protein
MSRVLDLMTPAHGQCRLVYVSATQIKLQPHNGRNLCINGLPEQIPTAGVTIANTGLSANTVYYVYAYMNGPTMTLELSTTGRSTWATYGIETKSNDTSRTLVGLVVTNGSSQFQDSSTVIGVLSFFNRRRKMALNYFTAARSHSNTTATELASEIRVNFINWAEEQASARANGGIWATTAGPVYAYIGVDTNSQSDSGGGCGVIGSQVPFAAEYTLGGLTENASHFASIYAIAAAGGSVTMTGNAAQAAGQRTSLSVAVMG